MNAKFSTNFPLHPSILAFIEDSNCRKTNQNVSMYNYHRNVLIKFKQLQLKQVKNVSKIDSVLKLVKTLKPGSIQTDFNQKGFINRSTSPRLNEKKRFY